MNTHLQASPATLVRSGHAPINGLSMYYEVHGSGPPIVSLHAGMSTAGVYPALAEGRTLIAMDLQGHGRTADIDRPFSFAQNADDVAALLGYLGIANADVFGVCFGGTASLVLALRHPHLVRRVVTYGASNRVSGRPPFGADHDAVAFHRELYRQVAVDPGHWDEAFEKVCSMGWDGFTAEMFKNLGKRVLIAVGDHDFIPVPAALELARMIPDSQLAVVPGAGHFLLNARPEKFLPMARAFLDEAPPFLKYSTPFTGYRPGENS